MKLKKDLQIKVFEGEHAMISKGINVYYGDTFYLIDDIWYLESMKV